MHDVIVNKFLVAAFFLLFCSCKTLHGQKAANTMPPATDPGTCNVEGQIVAVIEPSAKDSGTICAKYPCRAKVKILNVFGCASAVSIPLHGEDILEMKFAYTLHSTEIFPDMKTHFPGLKKGDVFTATAKQHMVVGSGGEFVIYDYKVE